MQMEQIADSTNQLLLENNYYDNISPWHIHKGQNRSLLHDRCYRKCTDTMASMSLLICIIKRQTKQHGNFCFS